MAFLNSGWIIRRSERSHCLGYRSRVLFEGFASRLHWIRFQEVTKNFWVLQLHSDRMDNNHPLTQERVWNVWSETSGSFHWILWRRWLEKSTYILWYSSFFIGAPKKLGVHSSHFEFFYASDFRLAIFLGLRLMLCLECINSSTHPKDVTSLWLAAGSSCCLLS